MTQDTAARRSARLLVGEDVDDPRVLRALRPRRVPPRPVRIAQALALRKGLPRDPHAPARTARRTALGPGAAGPPRFLVRVDETPYYTAHDHPDRYGLDMSRRFHAIMAEAGVPHLMSVIPGLTARPLDPDATGGRPLGDAEIALLREMAQTGVAFAQHGTTHRTRDTRPRHHSELLGRTDQDLGTHLDRGRAALRDAGIETSVLVPPFNRFDAASWPVLAERYDVVTGGPESVLLMGLHPAPLWRGGAVYLPTYAPEYGRAEDLLPVVERHVAAEPGTWVVIALHSGWEADDGFVELPRLARALAPHAENWTSFLAAVRASAGTSASS